MVFLFDLNLLTQSIDIFLILQVKAGAIYQSKHVTQSKVVNSYKVGEAQEGATCFCDKKLSKLG